MKEKRSTKQYVNPSKSSHLWRFRMKREQAIELERAIQEGGFSDCSSFLRLVVSERLLVSQLLAEEAKKAVAPVLRLCASDLGLKSVNNALGDAGFCVVETKTLNKLKKGVSDG